MSLSLNPDALDPFFFRDGLKSDDELLRLRKGNKGSKKIAGYQLKQNIVCFLHTPPPNLPPLTAFPQLIASLLKPMETHIFEAQEQEKAVRLPVSLLYPAGSHQSHARHCPPGQDRNLGESGRQLYPCYPTACDPFLSSLHAS